MAGTTQAAIARLEAAARFSREGGGRRRAIASRAGHNVAPVGPGPGKWIRPPAGRVAGR